MSKLTNGKVVAGLDLGDRFSWLCVLDDGGEAIEEARIQTTERAFRGWFAERGPIRVALEVGTHSPWVSRLLAGLGHEVIVANARHVRMIYGGDRKKRSPGRRGVGPVGPPRPGAPQRHRTPQ